MSGMGLEEIAVYLQGMFERKHRLEEIGERLESSLAEFGSMDRLWDYIAEHEHGLYMEFDDGVNIIL